MQRNCVACGRLYETVRDSSRTFSDRCRKQKQAGVTAPPSARPDAVAGTALESATRVELVAVGRLDTAKGQAALLLARRIDAGTDTGAAIAALAGQWRQTLEAALQSASRPDSALDGVRDELARRRSTRGA